MWQTETLCGLWTPLYSMTTVFPFIQQIKHHVTLYATATVCHKITMTFTVTLDQSPYLNPKLHLWNYIKWDVNTKIVKSE